MKLEDFPKITARPGFIVGKKIKKGTYICMSHVPSLPEISMTVGIPDVEIRILKGALFYVGSDIGIPIMFNKRRYYVFKDSDVLFSVQE